jgi:hypothetical protein
MIELVKTHGVRHWGLIGSKLSGRTGKQCRERWHNQLDPGIVKQGWSEEEELKLQEVNFIVMYIALYNSSFSNRRIVNLVIDGLKLRRDFLVEQTMLSRIIGTARDDD